MDIIDVQDVLSALKTVVNKVDENYVYEGACRYVDEDGNPACIVARVAHELSLPLPQDSSYLNTRSACTVAKELGWPLTQRAKLLLKHAQEEQDGLDGEDRQAWQQILLNTVDRAFQFEPVSA